MEVRGSVSNVLTDAGGGRGASLHRGFDDPGSFTLLVEWDSVETHTALTNRPEFGSFGDASGPHLAGRPEVRHLEAVA